MLSCFLILYYRANSPYNKTVLPETRLALALRYLSGGQITEMKLIYDAGKRECCYSIWRVVDTINRRLVIEFPVHDTPKYAVLETEFRPRSR
jgi:hypothetical protein